MSSSMTTVGRFRDAYRALARARAIDGSPLIERTPVVLSEGDSWFSTPLYPNLMDGIARRVRGLYLRVERPGDTALSMFAAANSARLLDHLRTFRFDAMLLSAGGNDFVADFLARTFRAAPRLTPTQALARVAATGMFDKVLRAYQRIVDRAGSASPATRVIAHTYAYPRLLGVPAQPTVAQLGLVAFFKRSIGDWIGRHIDHALPARADQVAFVRALVDTFTHEVLGRVTGDNFSWVDLREALPDDAAWNDEMHPTAAGFDRLAAPFTQALLLALPPAKRGAAVTAEAA